jgi:KAP family P-loop domain
MTRQEASSSMGRGRDTALFPGPHPQNQQQQQNHEQQQNQNQNQGRLHRRLDTPTIERIILYIDDLDRCPEDKVVDVLLAIHLLLAFRLFVVVVGVDSRWLLHSLRLNSDVFEENANALQTDRAHWQSTPLNYLEKIFQIPFALQPMPP